MRARRESLISCYNSATNTPACDSESDDTLSPSSKTEQHDVEIDCNSSGDGGDVRRDIELHAP